MAAAMVPLNGLDISRFWELKNCVFCNSKLDETSKILHCLHGICTTCIETETDNTSIHCPCLKSTRGELFDFLRTPPDIDDVPHDQCSELICIQEATNICAICKKILCDTCSDAHMSTRMDHDTHIMLNYPLKKSDVTCPKCIEKYVEVYCTECKKMMCSLCHLLFHKTHGYKVLANIIVEIKSYITVEKAEVVKKKHLIDQTLEELEEEINKMRVAHMSAKSTFDRELEKLRHEMYGHAISIKRTMIHMFEKSIKKVNESKRRVDEVCAKTQRMLYILDSNQCQNQNLLVNGPLLVPCASCYLWAAELVQCSDCKRYYHHSCHIPPIPESLAPKDSFITQWTCTMCEDLSKYCKNIDERIEMNCWGFTLDVIERKIVNRILLELFCQTENSGPFRDCPAGALLSGYYDVIHDPISLNEVKMKLENKVTGYKSFIEVISDIRRVLVNAFVYYNPEHLHYFMAQRLQRYLNRLLIIWIPKLDLVTSNGTEPVWSFREDIENSDDE